MAPSKKQTVNLYQVLNELFATLFVLAFSSPSINHGCCETHATQPTSILHQSTSSLAMKKTEEENFF